MLVGCLVIGALIFFTTVCLMRDNADRQHGYDVYGPKLDADLRRRGAPESALDEQRREYERTYKLRPYDR